LDEIRLALVKWDTLLADEIKAVTSSRMAAAA